MPIWLKKIVDSLKKWMIALNGVLKGTRILYKSMGSLKVKLGQGTVMLIQKSEPQTPCTMVAKPGMFLDTPSAEQTPFPKGEHVFPDRK